MGRDHQHEDWDQLYSSFSGNADFNPTLQYRNRLIFSWIRKQAPASGPTRVLDVGSGMGNFAKELKEAYPTVEVLGIDKSRVGVDVSLKRLPGETFIQGDLQEEINLPERYQGWATLATCSEVLEHIDEPERILKHIRPYLSSDCQLLITVPSGPMSEFYRYIGHRRHYTPGTLRTLLESSGYEVLRIVQAGFPFFNIYRLLLSLRGKNAIRDAESRPGALRFLLTKLVMKAFSILFRFNISHSPFGWQLVAVTRKKLEPAGEVTLPIKKAA